MKFLFIYSPFVIYQILGKGLAGLFFEETHEVTGVGKVELVCQLAHVQIGEQQFVFQFLQQTLLEQVGSRYAELRHDGIVERDAAHVQHIGIFLNTLCRANMLFKQVLELECVIVFRHFDRQMIGFGVCPIDNHQQIVKHRYNKVVRVCHRMSQFLFYLF